MQPRLSHQAQRFGRKGHAAAIAALLAAISLPQLPAQAAGVADPASAMEPARDEALSYAVGLQAYIDAFPMMDLYRTLWETSFDPGRGYDRTLNEFFVFDSLVTSADDWVVTPNEDTIYLRAFLDLRAEPVILVIPPSNGRKYWIPVGDMRHDISANLSWDTIGAQGGAFALVGPGWQGVLPEGVKRIDVGTPIAWTLPRFAVNGAADLPSAVAMHKWVRLVPLSQWRSAKTIRPKPVAADFPRFTRAELLDARSYFTTMNQLLRLTPRAGAAADSTNGWLAELNLAPSTSFQWDKLSPEARRGLERAVADGNRIIAQRVARILPVANNWQLARLDKQLSVDPVIAASAAMQGLLWNPREISTYDLAFSDGQGAALDGRKRYIIHFARTPPVDALWSMTMYSTKTGLFVANSINRYSIGDRTPGTVYGKDGSLTLFVQRDPPTDAAERANWLPAPDGPFYLVTRHYSPRPAILTGEWLPPPIVPR